MTEKSVYDPVTGIWNDSLTGDFLWSRNNFGEARPNIMTPLTLSIADKVWRGISVLPGYSMSGNICGRFYANVSVAASVFVAMGKSVDAAKDPVDVEALLSKRRAEFEAAWRRLKARYPKQAPRLRRQIDRVGPATRMREAVRNEATRFLWVEREWALRAGELTGLGDDIFMLTIDEVLDLLSGNNAAAGYIPTRKETYARYHALPTYPMIIRGHFDPFRWAADPQRRNDIYDATATAPIFASNMISGFAGAVGCVEGRVRVLAGPEQGDQPKPGDIRVAVTPDLG
jgi:hypothetical protein